LGNNLPCDTALYEKNIGPLFSGINKPSTIKAIFKIEIIGIEKINKIAEINLSKTNLIKFFFNLKFLSKICLNLFLIYFVGGLYGNDFESNFIASI
jgi:hypothetical protein